MHAVYLEGIGPLVDEVDLEYKFRGALFVTVRYRNRTAHPTVSNPTP